MKINWKQHAHTNGDAVSPNTKKGSVSKFRKTAIVAATVALAAGGSLAVAAPALASSSVCTRYPNGSGNKLCVATVNLVDGTVVTGNSSTNIRSITLQDQHFKNQSREVYRLVFAGDTSKCVGLSSAGSATIRDCSGNSNFTNWQEAKNSDSSVTWINNSYVNGLACPLYDCVLASDGTGGHQLVGEPSGTSGGFEKWTPVP